MLPFRIVPFAALAAFLALPAAAQAAQVLQVEGARSSRDFACEDGQDVSISGAGHKVVLTGDCGALAIHGSGHEVSFETARSLQVSGIRNGATGKTVGKLTVDATQNRVATAVKANEGRAEIAIAGAEQVVELRLGGPASITVQGAKNRVDWTAEAGVEPPDVAMAGIDNKVGKR